MRKDESQARSEGSPAFLFTGFPGFIGVRLLPRLLELKPGARAVCLVQEKFVTAAREAVVELESRHPHVRGRIELAEGDITVQGTNFFDEPISETIPDTAATIIQGIKVFKTVTAISKETVGSAGTVDVETGLALGILERVKDAAGILTADGTAEAVVIDADENSFAPTTAPDGSVDFDLLCNV